jgi:hypothetical protein
MLPGALDGVLHVFVNPSRPYNPTPRKYLDFPAQHAHILLAVGQVSSAGQQRQHSNLRQHMRTCSLLPVSCGRQKQVCCITDGHYQAI